MHLALRSQIYICETKMLFTFWSRKKHLIISKLMMTSSNIFRVTGLCAGNLSVPGEFPTQRPVTRSFDVFFDRINGWVNNRGAGDLRRYCAHYDVTVMFNFFEIESAHFISHAIAKAEI